MPNAPTLRDWTYVALIAVLLTAYASGLLSQAAKAGEAKDPPPSVCVFHDMASNAGAH